MDTQDVGVEAATLTERAMQLLTRDILSLTLKPGAKLVVNDLAETYQIGATPIREALSRLTARDLVTASGRRGFNVQSMSFADLQDITRARLLIESEALCISMREGDYDWEAQIVAAMHRLKTYVRRAGPDFTRESDLFENLHRDFHAALIGGCGSPRLISMAADLYAQAYRYRRSSHAACPSKDELIDAHERLANVILARDTNAALKRLKDHLNLTVTGAFPNETKGH
ncbi:GntR family transcriptional regulator [Paracoccus aerodenitrificans]|uniref:GntR family transcriptional regulator n=1 Tax=Paracoccus aerodenitrificans TaxID=3017781 RepID=UPI0022F068B9|nr:GntR family transcriptional regulator [Paracoccus aerodenitrificans]WBU63543.1 GntR family transcriptional regulator [Paracoccus aerodenitrificans]